MDGGEDDRLDDRRVMNAKVNVQLQSELNPSALVREAPNSSSVIKIAPDENDLYQMLSSSPSLAMVRGDMLTGFSSPTSTSLKNRDAPD